MDIVLTPNFDDNVRLIPLVDGSTVVFQLPHVPNPPNCLELIQNNVCLVQGTHYTLAGSTVTFFVAPASTDFITATYRF